MKSIIFDSGPIISFATNSLLSVLRKLKVTYGGSFCITPAVYKEIITKPLSGKKFKFEALRVEALLRDGTITLYDTPGLRDRAQELESLANQVFTAKDVQLRIVHDGEMEALAACVELSAESVAVDERTTRMLIEDPESLAQRLEKKLHTSVHIDRELLNRLQQVISGIKVLRSTELALVAYEYGLLDQYLPDSGPKYKELLDSVLWTLKLSGCAVSEKEITILTNIELKMRRHLSQIKHKGL